MNEDTMTALYNALAEVPPMANIFVPNLPNMIDLVLDAIEVTVADTLVIIWVGSWPEKKLVDLAIIDKHYIGNLYAKKVIRIGDINDLHCT